MSWCITLNYMSGGWDQVLTSTSNIAILDEGCLNRNYGMVPTLIAYFHLARLSSTNRKGYLWASNTSLFFALWPRKVYWKQAITITHDNTIKWAKTTLNANVITQVNTRKSLTLANTWRTVFQITRQQLQQKEQRIIGVWFVLSCCVNVRECNALN